MRRYLLAAAVLGLGLSAPAMAQDITVGVAGPMTGKEATFGGQFKAGADAALADFNAAGGVLGKKLKLEVGDDACDPKQARSVAEKLAGAKLPFVVGHYCSGSSIPASQVYAEAGVVQISPASTNPKFTDERAGPSIFRVCGRDDQQGGVAGGYLAKNFKDKVIAVVHDKSAYGKGLADETKKALNAAGKEEAIYEAITAGEKDYTALVSKLKQANVDVVYFGGYHTEAGLIVRQMRSQGMKTVLMGGDSMVTTEYWQITGKDGEGTLFTFSPDPRKNPAAAEVVKAFEAKKVNPEGYVLYTYAALQVWKQAVEKAGSTDAEKVVAALNGTEFKTVIGNFSFDKKGDPNLPPYVVYSWKDGAYDQL
ncbi:MULTISPECIES: branched-chain amino acid ABC transporter substrate-binding protein [Rhodomicrobium]|uniref:branched-chain amino acid ABC transporter substrate-binding protein n=1 Tax=Rhodomicrobium TaxID=1068 RepID=UPI000B4BE807|nr:MULTISPECIES: branched-chain amino acid ABC transporter substrate-binding protein [Rhodomicrobium]